MAALLALGYSMLVQEQEKKDDASDTPAATHDPSVSTSSLPQVTTPDPSASVQPTKSTRSSATRSSTIKGEADGESSRKGSSKRQKMHASTKALDEQYAKQMAKVAKLMRKMERAEQRERNARWKAAMQDITQARAAGIDPQKDKVGWDDESDDEDTLHPADASLKKPITNLSAKPDDSDAPAPESGDTLARFIHAMFSSMNPFEEAAHVEKGDDSATDPATSKSTEGSSKPASKDPKDQQASEEVLRLLSSASTMNQASQSRGSVWNVLDRLTPGRSKKAGPNDAEGSLMISAPLFITEDSKVEVAKSSMRTIEEHDSDSEDSKPRSSKFANLVNKMGMDGMFGSKKKSEEEPAEAEPAEVKAEPEPRPVKEVRVWQPSADGISLQCSWWGYRIYLPPPVLAVLNDQKLEAAKRAALVTTALQWMIDHVPTALLPPQVGLLMSLIRGIIPALGYIGGFVAWSWSAIIGFDQGDGVILSATWLLPIALIPGAWDVEPVRPAAKELEPEPEPVVEAKATKSSLSRSASFAKKMPSLERKPSTKSSSSGSKEKKAERKVLERSTTEATAVPKRPTEPARRPTVAGPLPTPPSAFPRASGISRSQSSTPPVTKVKESKDSKPEADRPALKKTPSKMGLNIVWSDKPVSEEPKDDEETEKKPSFKLPMPDVTWDHERKAAEAEAAAKLAAEQQAKDAAKAKLKNKYAQALREQMTKDKAPVGWSALS